MDSANGARIDRRLVLADVKRCWQGRRSGWRGLCAPVETCWCDRHATCSATRTIAQIAIYPGVRNIDGIDASIAGQPGLPWEDAFSSRRCVEHIGAIAYTPTCERVRFCGSSDANPGTAPNPAGPTPPATPSSSKTSGPKPTASPTCSPGKCSSRSETGERLGGNVPSGNVLRGWRVSRQSVSGASRAG